MLKLRREGVAVPGVLSLEWEVDGNSNGGGWMLMEWIEGKTVKEIMIIVKLKGAPYENSNDAVANLMMKVGKAIGQMHEVGVVHGDLTTSNIMLRTQHVTKRTVYDDGSLPDEMKHLEHLLSNGEVVLIDFGLAGQSIQDEDKAVDLYVLERAFGSTHPEAEDQFVLVLRAYGESYKGAKVVLKRLEDVRMRGRKKSMIG